MIEREFVNRFYLVGLNVNYKRIGGFYDRNLTEFC